jgi:GNAT superfamily N-acetyltransferase
LIRELRDEDVPGLAALWRELRPDGMQSVSGLRHLVESSPARAEAAHWVVDEGVPVAWAMAHRRWWRATTSAYLWVGVLPGARGRGLGSRLYELAEAHVAAIGADAAHADAVGDAAGEAFLLRRGFSLRRTVVISAVDPRSVDFEELEPRLARAAGAGYRIVPYAEVDPERLFRLDLTASADEPGETEPHAGSFEDWKHEFWEHPDLTHEGSFAALAEKEPVAYSALSVDAATARGRNEGTATAQEHRGRGLATLAKLAQLSWAAEHGIARVITDNDEQNAPMLAVNRRLGYRPFVERRGFVKALQAGGETASARAPGAPAT